MIFFNWGVIYLIICSCYVKVDVVEFSVYWPNSGVPFPGWQGTKKFAKLVVQCLPFDTPFLWHCHATPHVFHISRINYKNNNKVATGHLSGLDGQKLKNWFWPAFKINWKIQGARVRFPLQLSKFPRFGRPERENWVALIHEQGHSGQKQLWELVRSI